MSKTLDRIAALLAQAEDKSATEAEAAAYVAKAQQLATLAAVDLETARQHQADKTRREEPIQRTITVAGKVGSRVQNNAAEYCSLFLAIGSVQDVEFDIAHNSTYVVAYGLPSDIEVTEALYSSLVVQMKQAVDEALKRGDHKAEGVTEYWDERTWTTRTRKPDARRFKTAFYRGFADRIGKRLLEAKREAIKEIEAAKSFDIDGPAVVTATPDVDVMSTETGLVLRAKAAEVKAFREANTDARGTWGGARRSNTSKAGRQAGIEAGSKARIGAPKAIGNRTAIH